MPKGKPSDYRLKDVHPKIQGKPMSVKAKIQDFKHHEGRGLLPMPTMSDQLRKDYADLLPAKGFKKKT